MEKRKLTTDDYVEMMEDQLFDMHYNRRVKPEAKCPFCGKTVSLTFQTEPPYGYVISCESEGCYRSESQNPQNTRRPRES